MQESLKLFGSVCNVKWFSHASMILFLNKKDLFKEKIKTVSLRKCFPSFSGDPQSFTVCANYVSDQFTRRNLAQEKEIFRHFICAKESDNIRQVFNCTTDVLQRNLAVGGSLY